MRVKVEHSQTSRKTYNEFCVEHPDIKISYLDFINIIYTFNYGFRDYLLETGMKAKLPYGFGDFAVSKRKQRLTRKIKEGGYEVTALPIDWKKTKQHKKYIYHMNAHTNGFKFRLKWFCSSARLFKWAEIWNFKPSRVTSRLIKHYVVDLNQADRYYQWDILSKI